MQQLETAILRHLDEFIDVEGAWKIAEEWSKAPRANKIVDAALSSVSERVHFSRLLRALVRDGVPLVHGGVILEVLRNTPITSVSLPAIARSIRLKMRDCLPGNGPDVLKINFDGELSMSAGPPGPRLALSSDPKAVHELIRTPAHWSTRNRGTRTTGKWRLLSKTHRSLRSYGGFFVMSCRMFPFLPGRKCRDSIAVRFSNTCSRRIARAGRRRQTRSSIGAWP